MAKKVEAKATKKETTRKTIEPKELTKEQKSAIAMEKMDASTLEAQVAWKKMDKKMQATVKAFFTEWFPKAGWKKVAKMMGEKDFLTKSKE